MGTASRAVLKAAFFAVALPAILRAAVRVVHLGRLPLNDTASNLRHVPLFRVSWLRRRPDLLAASVERLLHVLPPWSYGRCLNRSLLLLDLWSRCGLAPRLHLSFRGDASRTRGHAWLSARDEHSGREFVTPSHGYPEAFTL